MPGMPGERLPATLYHYTDIYGLQGIFENGELWATNGLYLNDTSELSLGLKNIQLEVLRRYTEILERRNQQLASGKQLPPSAELDELDVLRDLIDHALENANCYVVSLSAVGDQLSQWRAYAKDGYCIGFSTKELRKSLGEDQFIGRVKYDDKAWDTAAKKHIRFARALWRESADWDYKESVRRFVVTNEIVKEAAFVKDSHFSEEKEVRIVEPHGIPNHFTPSARFGMVPRLKIPISTDCLTSVTVGPGVHSELRARSLIDYFVSKRFADGAADANGPTVRRSVIPYRDW